MKRQWIPSVLLIVGLLLATAAMPGPSPTSTGSPVGRVRAGFDGNGRADLAVGVPYEDVGTVVDAGAANVLYGSSGGLSSTGDQIWDQESPNLEGVSETNDKFAFALATGDFDRDGFWDLAIGVPGEDVGTLDSAGVVQVQYGTASGLSATGDQLWHQDVSGVEGGSEAGDQFGYALATGDFNGDGYCDLAIGVPTENVDSVTDGGAVNVLYGSSGGLTATGDQIWHQDIAGIEGGAELGDSFGYSLAAGDFNGDGRADLAVGVPFEDIGALGNAGAVNILYGSASGLSATGDQIWDQDIANVEGQPEAGDQFGFSVAAGDFNGDGRADLAAGVPGESVGLLDDAGAVNILYGSAGGLSATGDQIWDQDSPNIEGGAEAGDEFGFAMTAGDFNGDGRADLAVGEPFEDVGAVAAAGAVNVLYGSASGLTATGDQIWHQEIANIEGAAETNDYYGRALAAGDFDGDGRADLAIGVPGEDIGTTASAGAVGVLYGSAGGLTSTGDQLWHQDITGIEGGAEAGDQFGFALAAAQAVPPPPTPTPTATRTATRTPTRTATPTGVATHTPTATLPAANWVYLPVLLRND